MKKKMVQRRKNICFNKKKFFVKFLFFGEKKKL